MHALLEGYLVLGLEKVRLDVAFGDGHTDFWLAGPQDEARRASVVEWRLRIDGGPPARTEPRRCREASLPGGLLYARVDASLVACGPRRPLQPVTVEQEGLGRPLRLMLIVGLGNREAGRLGARVSVYGGCP